jgi:Mg-chelatase subunit ChlD
MRRNTLDGREKLEAVQAAALMFVDRMDFVADGFGGRDKVAVVGFNNDAWIEQRLTSNPEAVRSAVGRLRRGMKEGTRLDLALEWGARALVDPARSATNTPAIVFLTDGMPNKVPPADDGTMETTVLRVADAVKGSGALIYTIGVGLPEAPDLADRINTDLLRSVASRPDMAFQTFSAEELGAIYGQLAYTVGCPAGRRWP